MPQKKWETNRPSNQQRSDNQYRPRPNNGQFHAPPTYQQSNQQNGTFINPQFQSSNGPPMINPQVQYVQGYNQPPIQQFMPQPTQQPVFNGYNGFYQQQNVPSYNQNVGGYQHFVPPPLPVMQYNQAPPVYYYPGPPQGMMPHPNVPPMQMTYAPMSMTDQSNVQLQRLDNDVPRANEAPAAPVATAKPNEKPAKDEAKPEDVTDAFRELQIKINVLESVVRYNEKNGSDESAEQQSESDSLGSEKEKKSDNSTSGQEASSSKKLNDNCPDVIRNVVTEIKKSVQLVDKLLKQEQISGESSEKRRENNTTTGDVDVSCSSNSDSSEILILNQEPIETSLESSQSGAVKSKSCEESVDQPEASSKSVSPAPSDPTMPVYSPPPVQLVQPTTTTVKNPIVSRESVENHTGKLTEKKPVDYSQWVDVKKQYKKWNDEEREKNESKIIKMSILVLAKEVPFIPFEVIEEESEVRVPDAETTVVVEKKKNRPKKKKRENQQKAQEEEDIDEILSSITNEESKKKDKGKKAKEEPEPEPATEAEKEAQDVLLDENQIEQLQTQIRDVLPKYCYHTKMLRQIYCSFEKDRGPLPEFQMEIINHWKSFFLFGLEHRCRRQGIYRKVLERILMYRNEPTPDSQKMFIFLEAFNKTRDIRDEVVNADLLFLYETKKEDDVLREQEKKYFETVLTFPEWKPKVWNRVPVLIQDLKSIPVKIDNERLEFFHSLLNKQGLKRIMSKTAPDIRDSTMTCSIEEVLHIAHWSSREQETDWSTLKTRDFLNARLAVIGEDEQSPINILYAQLYEFLLHVTSSVLNFNVFWLKACFQYSDGKAILKGEDVLLTHLFGPINM